MIRGARGCSGQAEESYRLNQPIIAYSHHLSITFYKWFGCCGIAASKAETRNVKVETGRQRESKPAPFVKPNPKGCATRVVEFVLTGPLWSTAWRSGIATTSRSSMARLAVKSLGVPTLVGLALLSLVLCPSACEAQQRPNTPGCDVHVDLQYELRPGTAVRSPVGEVAPEVAQVIMSKAGEVDWDELTKHGRKYQGICRDDEHPYYVLVWKVADWGAEAGLYVLDNGCLVVPSVSGTVSIITNSDQRDKAIKKVFEAALRFLAEKGKQPAR